MPKVIAVALLSVSVVVGQTNVLTFHNDNSRTGQNTAETVLTPSIVNSTQFGKLSSVSVDGYVLAQPLVLTNVAIPGQGIHDVVYIVTENDSLYAIDADIGSVLWQVNFLNPALGVTTVPTADLPSCTDVGPQIGITSTPVINPATGTIYLVASTKENGAYVQRLHAIDVASHAEKFGGPVLIQASVSGTGISSVNGSVAFDPLLSNQRSGLLLENGHIVIAWGSHCDQSPYHGWVMSYNAATLAQEAAFSPSPNGAKSGIWMSGGGLAADSNSNIYAAVADGDYDGISEWGDSVLKLAGPTAGSLAVVDWFTPHDQSTMQNTNKDLGASGLILLPDLPSGQQLLVVGSKASTIYLIDRNNMGKYCSSCTSTDTQIVQEIPAGVVASVFSVPAYWNGNVYFGPRADYLKAFSFNTSTGALSSMPTSLSPDQFGYPGTTPSISSNAGSGGIVWALLNANFNTACCQILRAYDATNLATELYASNQAPNNLDVPGGAVKFNVPTIANGKVYVGSQATLSIFGPHAPVAARPTFSPVAGSYASAQSVTISDTSPGVTIYYTTDGSTPTTSSTVFTNAIPVNATTTIRAIAAGGGFLASSVANATYIIQAAATPAFSPAAGTYTSAQSVTISDTSPGVTIYYTTDGTTPTTSSTVFTNAIPVNATTTIKAVAAGGGFSASSVATATYVFQSPAAMPTFSLPGATYTWPHGISISDSSPGVTIYYTTDGTTPTTASTVYKGTISLSTTTTLRAIAAGNGFLASPVASATYTFQCAKPAFSPAAGVYSSSQSVTISDSSPSVTIYYTTDGSTPTTSSTPYTGTIPVSVTTTIQAIAVRSGFLNSPLASATYTIQSATPAAAPTFSLPGATYTWPRGVSISDSSAGATIYYTTDGRTPTTSSTVYTGSIALSTTTTLQAMAAGNGFLAGPVTSATYTFQAAKPTLSPAPGIYNSSQSVTISDTSPGVTIYYTTDGSTPTASSTVYSTAIPVSATTTIQAIAKRSGFLDSPLASGTYTIQPVTPAAIPVFSLPGGTYTWPHGISISDSSAGVTIYYTTNGSTPTTASAVYTGPIPLSSTTTLQAIAAGSGFSASGVASATYTFQAANPTFSPAAGSYTSAQSVTIADSSPGVTIYYTTDGSTPTTSSTQYAGAIPVSTTTTIQAIAARIGFLNSAVVSATYTIH